MPMRFLGHPAVLILALCLLGGSGGAFWGWQQAGEKRAVAAAAAGARARQIEETRRINRELAEKVATLQRARAASPIPDALAEAVPTVHSVRSEALRTVAGLSRAGIVMVMEGGRRESRESNVLEPRSDKLLAPGFAEVFGLSAPQFAMLQDTLRAFGQKADAVIVAHAVVTRPADNILRIEVNALPELAAERARIRAAFVTAMGEEGVATYEALRRGGIDSLFNQLGGVYEKSPMVATLTRTPPGSDASSRFSGRSGSDENGNSYQTRTMTGDAASLASNMRNLGPLAKLVPADFLKSGEP